MVDQNKNTMKSGGLVPDVASVTTCFSDTVTSVNIKPVGNFRTG